MIPPREPESAEPTLLPVTPSVSPSAAPNDTPAHPAAHDETIAPPPVPVMPSGITEADATRAPASISNATAATEVEATRMPMPTRVGTPEKTVGSGKTVANGVPAPPPSSPAATGTMVGRFALKGMHAKGGLGEVFTARDTELNRDVAVKRIQSRYADDPASRRRFLTEAEITARLDHPGVVPVFGLVADGFGRPCYAMRFIRGETLKDEIDRYHNRGSGAGSRESDKTEKTESTEAGVAAPQSQAPESQPRSVAFRHLLQRFIAVCQAIAYAHTRKVIHRDIKPANVMVGSFGETLVVDWGLAKALDDGPDTEKIMRTIAEGGFKHDPDATEFPSHMTLAGTAVGTPAYMAPEQASGNLELVGPAADVYSLGATLYGILTGKAPFSGATAEALDRVRRGEFPPPRSVNPETAAPLDAICRKAMALNPENRYSTALDLAADVERWLSDEPVSCYRDPFLARLARWARQHPARVAAGVSFLVAGVFAVAGVAWAVNEGRKKTQDALDLVTIEKKNTEEQRDRATAAEKDTAEERDRVKKEKKNTEEQRNIAIAARDVARDRYELAVKAFNTLVTDIQKQLADRAGTQEFRVNLLKQAQKGLNDLLKGAGAERIGADRTLVAAHHQMGDVYQILGNTTEARKEYEEAVRMADTVVELSRGSRESKRDLGRALVSLADSHLHAGDTAAARKECQRGLDIFRDILKASPGDREATADMATAEDRLAEILMEGGETGPATEQCEAGLKARRSLAETGPNDIDARRRLADSLDQFAQLLLHAGRTDEARKAAEECLLVRTAVWETQKDQPDYRRELAIAHARLAEVDIDRASLNDARQEYLGAIGILGELVRDDPRNAAARGAMANANSRLAFIELRTGNLNAALTHATAADTLCEELDKADPASTRTTRELARSREQLGEVLLARGKTDDALKAFIQSADWLAVISKNDPASAQAALEHARALERVGEGYLASGEPARAVTALKESVALRKHVRKIDLSCVPARRALAAGLGWLADAYRADDKPAQAADTVAQAVTLLHEVVHHDAKNFPARRELAAATGKWGEVLNEAGKPAMALVTVLQSLDQFLMLAAADKDNAHATADVAGAWERVAELYADLGKPNPAMTAASSALHLRVKLADLAGNTKMAKRELSESLTRVADIYATLRQFDEARKQYKKARELVAPDPSDPATTAAARRADDHAAILNAVEALMKDPGAGLERVPAELRIPTLRTAADWLIKGNQAITAGVFAGQLAAIAETKADRYAAARTLARCAATTNVNVTETAKKSLAKQAVAALDAAVTAGFHNGEALKSADWDSCRDLPEFQAIVKKLDAPK